MTRFEAVNAIYDVINSGIIDGELEDRLQDVANGLCRDGFEQCPWQCLQRCKLDECPHAEEWPEEEE